MAPSSSFSAKTITHLLFSLRHLSAHYHHLRLSALFRLPQQRNWHAGVGGEMKINYCVLPAANEEKRLHSPPVNLHFALHADASGNYCLKTF
jgi:plasmid maintenance system killer protein